MSSHVRFLMSSWPLLVIEVSGDMSRVDMRQLARDQEELVSRNERYVTMTDLSDVTNVPDARTRGELAAWMHAVERDTLRLQVANVLVVSSTLVRHVLTALHWLAPPPVPTAVVATRAEAIAYLVPHARRAGLAADWASGPRAVVDAMVGP